MPFYVQISAILNEGPNIIRKFHFGMHPTNWKCNIFFVLMKWSSFRVSLIQKKIVFENIKKNLSSESWGERCYFAFRNTLLQTPPSSLMVQKKIHESDGNHILEGLLGGVCVCVLFVHHPVSVVCIRLHERVVRDPKIRVMNILWDFASRKWRSEFRNKRNWIKDTAF